MDLLDVEHDICNAKINLMVPKKLIPKPSYKQLEQKIKKLEKELSHIKEKIRFLNNLYY